MGGEDKDTVASGSGTDGGPQTFRALETRWNIGHGPANLEMPGDYLMTYGYARHEPEYLAGKMSQSQLLAGEAPPILSAEARAAYFADLQKNVTLLRSMADHEEARQNLGKLFAQLGDSGIFDMENGKLRMSRALERRTYNKDGSRRRLTPEDVWKVNKPEKGYSSLLSDVKGRDVAGGIAIKPDVIKVASAKFEAPKVAKIEIPKAPPPKPPLVVPKLK